MYKQTQGLCCSNIYTLSNKKQIKARQVENPIQICGFMNIVCEYEQLLILNFKFFSGFYLFSFVTRNVYSLKHL